MSSYRGTGTLLAWLRYNTYGRTKWELPQNPKAGWDISKGKKRKRRGRGKTSRSYVNVTELSIRAERRLFLTNTVWVFRFSLPSHPTPEKETELWVKPCSPPSTYFQFSIHVLSSFSFQSSIHVLSSSFIHPVQYLRALLLPVQYSLALLLLHPSSSVFTCSSPSTPF